MRKPQSQPSLVGLAEAEREQLADWLRREDYDVVRDRVNKPRPEGFGLAISVKPLRTLWAKVALLDLINSRLREGRKLTLAEFESLASRDISLLASADSEKIAGIHDTILNAVHDLASGENTPAQFLSLQRLADFPARAALRAERAENDAAYRDHKIEMDTFRKEMAEKRFNLAEKTLAFRQQQHQDRLTQRAQTFREQQLPRLAESKSAVCAPTASSPNSAVKESDLDRLAKTLDAVERRTCETFNLPYDGPTKQESSPQTEKNSQADTSPLPPLPPVQNSEIQAPTASSPHSALGSSPLITDHAVTDHSIAHSPTQTATEESKMEAPTASSLQSAICDLKSKVDAYTVKRAQEYWAYRRQYSDPPPPRKSHPQYVTQYRHCPCGAACPCPVHENKEAFGPFPNSFWTSSPHSDFYYEPLIARGLPYREPKEFL